MSEIDLISLPQTVLSFIISIVTLLMVILGVFKWKLNQALASQKFKTLSQVDVDNLEKAISTLCAKLEELNKRVEKEIISAKEEHASMQIQYHELVKELYKLIGEVKAMRNNGHI